MDSTFAVRALHFTRPPPLLRPSPDVFKTAASQGKDTDMGARRQGQGGTLAPWYVCVCCKVICALAVSQHLCFEGDHYKEVVNFFSGKKCPLEKNPAGAHVSSTCQLSRAETGVSEEGCAVILHSTQNWAKYTFNCSAKGGRPGHVGISFFSIYEGEGQKVCA